MQSVEEMEAATSALVATATDTDTDTITDPAAKRRKA